MAGVDTYTPLVFISHSAKDPLARELLSRIYGALNAEYEVLLDRKRLQPKNDWRKELHTWLGLCQGAVLLLSEHAVESDWVLKESTILGYRREMDDKFILVPVLVPPVTAETLKDSDFEPVALDAIQMASGKADEVVAQVLAALKPLKARSENKSPLRKVEQAVARVLSELEKDGRDAMIKAAKDKLEKHLSWRPDENYAQQLARELMSVDLDVAIEVLFSIAGDVGGSGKKLAAVVDALAAFWVEPDAVAELPRMHKRPRGQRAVRVNGVKCPFTGKCYIQRASLDFEWIHATADDLKKGYEEVPLEKKVEYLVDKIQEQIVPWLGFDEDAKPTPQEIEARLCDFEADEPIFVFVPKDFDENLLAELRAQLEWFTFFMLRDSRAFTTPGLDDWQIVQPESEQRDIRDSHFESLIGKTRSKLSRMK